MRGFYLVDGELDLCTHRLDLVIVNGCAERGRNAAFCLTNLHCLYGKFICWVLGGI